MYYETSPDDSLQAQPIPKSSFLKKIDTTLEMFAAACNYANQQVKPSITSKTTIQSLVYQTIREKFDLSANLAVRACARVGANTTLSFVDVFNEIFAKGLNGQPPENTPLPSLENSGHTREQLESRIERLESDLYALKEVLGTMFPLLNDLSKTE